MSTDPMRTLKALSHFLGTVVARGVGDDLRSEVRAAAKTLANLAQEVDCLPALLLAEARAMIELQDDAVAQLKHVAPDLPSVAGTAKHKSVLDQPLGPLSELLNLHAALQSDAELILVKLQAELRRSSASLEQRCAMTELAGRYYRMLGAQADARVQWQSVFPIPKPNVARECGQEEGE